MEDSIKLNKNIMSPWNARWPEFVKALMGPKSEWNKDGMPRCNGCLTDDNGIVNEESFAVMALKKMGMDIDQSIAFFEEFGGYCDCEIIMNVEEQCEGE